MNAQTPARQPLHPSILSSLPEEPYFGRLNTQHTRTEVLAALEDYEAMLCEWEAMLLVVEAAFDVADPGWNAYPGSMAGCKIDWMLNLHERLFSLQAVEAGTAYLPYAINRSDVWKPN